LLVVGDLSLDIKKYEVFCEGMPITLSSKEIQLLHCFLINKNIVLTREQILSKVLGI